MMVCWTTATELESMKLRQEFTTTVNMLQDCTVLTSLRIADVSVVGEGGAMCKHQPAISSELIAFFWWVGPASAVSCWDFLGHLENLRTLAIEEGPSCGSSLTLSHSLEQNLASLLEINRLQSLTLITSWRDGLPLLLLVHGPVEIRAHSIPSISLSHALTCSLIVRMCVHVCLCACVCIYMYVCVCVLYSAVDSTFAQSISLAAECNTSLTSLSASGVCFIMLSPGYESRI